MYTNTCNYLSTLKLSACVKLHAYLVWQNHVNHVILRCTSIQCTVDIPIPRSFNIQFVTSCVYVSILHAPYLLIYLYMIQIIPPPKLYPPLIPVTYITIIHNYAEEVGPINYYSHDSISNCSAHQWLL